MFPGGHIQGLGSICFIYFCLMIFCIFWFFHLGLFWICFFDLLFCFFFYIFSFNRGRYGRVTVHNPKNHETESVHAICQHKSSNPKVRPAPIFNSRLLWIDWWTFALHEALEMIPSPPSSWESTNHMQCSNVWSWQVWPLPYINRSGLSPACLVTLAKAVEFLW